MWLIIQFFESFKVRNNSCKTSQSTELYCRRVSLLQYTPGECRDCLQSACSEVSETEPDSSFVCDQAGQTKSICEFEMLRCIYEKKFGYNITAAYVSRLLIYSFSLMHFQLPFHASVGPTRWVSQSCHLERMVGQIKRRAQTERTSFEVEEIVMVFLVPKCQMLMFEIFAVISICRNEL